jgi:hypothetical protein
MLAAVGHTTSFIGFPTDCSTQWSSMPTVSPWRKEMEDRSEFDCQSATKAFRMLFAQRTLAGMVIATMA